MLFHEARGTSNKESFVPPPQLSSLNLSGEIHFTWTAADRITEYGGSLVFIGFISSAWLRKTVSVFLCHVTLRSLHLSQRDYFPRDIYLGQMLSLSRGTGSSNHLGYEIAFRHLCLRLVSTALFSSSTISSQAMSSGHMKLPQCQASDHSLNASPSWNNAWI